MIVITDAGMFDLDELRHELEHLAQLAAGVLNEHVSGNGLCMICGCAFPCESAVLAEHNVALL